MGKSKLIGGKVKGKQCTFSRGSRPHKPYQENEVYYLLYTPPLCVCICRYNELNRCLNFITLSWISHCFFGEWSFSYLERLFFDGERSFLGGEMFHIFFQTVANGCLMAAPSLKRCLFHGLCWSPLKKGAFSNKSRVFSLEYWTIL